MRPQITSVPVTLGSFTRHSGFSSPQGVIAFAFFTQLLPTGIVPMIEGAKKIAILYCLAFYHPLLLAVTGGGVHSARRPDSRPAHGFARIVA